MITLSLDPVILHIGHLAIRWYGLIVTLAIGVGLWITAREGRRRGLRDEDFNDGLLWIAPVAVVGARLFHVADHWSHEFAADPLRVLYIWEGGLAIWGAVVFGFAAVAVFAWRRRLGFSRLADMIAPGLVLGQGIGRIACVITGDAMGQATTGPLGIAYTNPAAMVPQLGVYYTPVPIYELLVDLGIFALLWRLRTRALPDGALFLIYLLLYSAGRFVLTFWSAYPLVALGLNQAQLISSAATLVALPWLVILLRRPARRRAALAS